MACLDDETVLAFVRNGLTEAQFHEAEVHLAGCADCCALVADAVRLTHPSTPADITDKPAILPPGTAVSRYVIEEALGAGGGGVVYRARDSELRRNVALKVLRTDTQDARVRWLREAQTMARLSHPNVVNVHDVGATTGPLAGGSDGAGVSHVYIVMELVEGQNAAQWLRVEARSWRAILDVFLQAGRGLAAAHAAGLVHGDFKPENILIGTDGRARVADFGLARAVDEATQEAIRGTPGFMAPEQFRGMEADARSDQFSFCVALYVALHGHQPLAKGTQAAPAAPTSTPVAAVPAPVDEALRRGLSDDPEARFAAMDDLLAALSADLVAALPPPDRRPAPWRPAPVSVAVAVVAVAAVLAVVVSLGRRHRVPALITAPTPVCLDSVALGSNHTCALRTDGTVWCWGKVGDDLAGPDAAPGEPESRVVPLQIRDVKGRPLVRIGDIAARGTTTCARERQSTVFCWGASENGKLGNGQRGSPRRIAAGEQVMVDETRILRRVIQVAPGVFHTCIRREEGDIFCWGSNVSGQLGIGPPSEEPLLRPRALPVTVSDGPAFARVSSGLYHTCATRSDSTLWCWGDGSLGKPGLGPDLKRATATSDPAGLAPRPVLRADGKPLSDVVDLDLGRLHSCAVLRAGGLVCWGVNQFGQLGSGNHDNAPAPVVVQRAPVSAMPDHQPLVGVRLVRAGNTFTCALGADGGVWCFGDNSFGQLGGGTAVAASNLATAVVREEDGRPLTDVRDLAVGDFSACALRRDGSLWCWGRNQGAQLGLADTRDRNAAVMARPPCP